MAQTKIQWTNETWNPFAGCSKISAGCKNCYAIRDAVRLAGNTNPKIAEKYAGTVTENNWTGKINLASDDTLFKPLRWTRPRMIFVNSMSDLFHENVPNEWIDKVFAVMALAQNHTFQILTKRADRMNDYCNSRMYQWFSPHIFDWLQSVNPKIALQLENATETGGHILPNVWLGVSVENQQAADERIPSLLETPAAVRWLSIEPILERVDLNNISDILYWKNCLETATLEPYFRPKIDWVVVGGESGERARECSLDWIYSIVRQCKTANVPVFVKQLGAKVRFESLDLFTFPETAKFGDDEQISGVLELQHRKGGEMSEFPQDLQVREFPYERLSKPAS